MKLFTFRYKVTLKGLRFAVEVTSPNRGEANEIFTRHKTLWLQHNQDIAPKPDLLRNNDTVEV